MKSSHFTDAELDRARADPQNTIMSTQYTQTEIKTVADNVADVRAVVAKANALLQDLHQEFHGTDEGDEQMRKRMIAECEVCRLLSTRCPHLFGILTTHKIYTKPHTVEQILTMIRLRDSVDTGKLSKEHADKLVQAFALTMAKKS